MLLDILVANLLENLPQVKKLSKQEKEKLEQDRVFYVTSSFNQLLNTKILSNEPRFNVVYSRSNLPVVPMYAAYVINICEYKTVKELTENFVWEW